MTTQISISRSIIFTVAFGLLGKPATAQYVRQLDDGPVITAYFQHAACGETENRDWHCGTNTYTSISADGKCYTHSGLDEGIPCLKATTKQILANGKVTTVRDQCLDYDHFAILAAADGYVLFTKEDCPDTCGTGSCFCPDARGIGNQVRLIDKFGRLLSFGHMRLQSVPDEITVGARVSCGDQLGEIGSSGNSTGPHLHFQVEYFNTEPTDPHDAIGKAVDPFGADWSDTRSGYCSDQTSTLWLDQPAYDQMPTSGCSSSCEAVPGQRLEMDRQTLDQFPHYLANFIHSGLATGETTEQELMALRAFSEAYGYRYYEKDAGILQSRVTPASLGCPEYVDGNGRTSGPSLVHVMIQSDGSLLAQDFFQADQLRRFAGSPGDTALVYRIGEKNAFLLRNELWGIYKCLKQDPSDNRTQAARTGGAKWLGAPITNLLSITTDLLCASQPNRTLAASAPGPCNGGMVIKDSAQRCVPVAAAEVGYQVQFFEKGYMTHLSDGVLRVHVCPSPSLSTDENLQLEKDIASSARQCGAISVVDPNPPTGPDHCHVGDYATCISSNQTWQTVGVGVCQAGISVCTKASPSIGADWGPCLGEIVPAPENCLDGLDNNCDGKCDCDDPTCAGHPCSSQGCIGQGGGIMGSGGAGGPNNGSGGSGGCATCSPGDRVCIDEHTLQTCSLVGGCATWTATACTQTPVRSHCKPASGCVQCGSILQDCCPSGLPCDNSLECQAESCLPGPGGAGGSGGTGAAGGASAMGGQGGSGGLSGSIAPPCGNQDQPCCVPGVPDPCVSSGLACVSNFCRLCGALSGWPCCSGSKCTNGLACSAGVCSTIDTAPVDANTSSGGIGGTGGAAGAAGGVGGAIASGGAPALDGSGGMTRSGGGSGPGGVNSVGGQDGLGGVGGSGSAADSPDASPDGPSAGVDSPADSPIALVNILQNPGFEDGQQYWDWWKPMSCLTGCSGTTLDCQAQCVPTVTLGAGHSGNMGIQLVTTKTSNCTNCFLYQPALIVSKGKSYRISFWARTTDETHIGVGVREHCGCPDLWNTARPSCPPTTGTCSTGTACCYEPYWSYSSGGTCSSTCFEAGGNAFIALTMDGTWHQYTVTTSLLGIAGTDQSRSDAKLSLAFSQSIGTVYIDDLEMVELP